MLDTNQVHDTDVHLFMIIAPTALPVHDDYGARCMSDPNNVARSMPVHDHSAKHISVHNRGARLWAGM